jgi:hypothetical protein
MNEKLKLLVKRCHQRVSVQPAQNVGAYRGLDMPLPGFWWTVEIPVCSSPGPAEDRKSPATVRRTLMAALVVLRRSSRREWTLHSQCYRGSVIIDLIRADRSLSTR